MPRASSMASAKEPQALMAEHALLRLDREGAPPAMALKRAAAIQLERASLESRRLARIAAPFAGPLAATAMLHAGPKGTSLMMLSTVETLLSARLTKTNRGERREGKRGPT